MSLREVFQDATRDFAKERLQAGHRTLHGWEDVSRQIEDQAFPGHKNAPKYIYRPSWPMALWVIGNLVGLVFLAVTAEAVESTEISDQSYALIGALFLGFNTMMFVVRESVFSDVERLNEPWREWREVETKRNVLAKKFHGEAKAILDHAWVIIDREQQEIRERKEVERARRRPAALENCTFQQAEELAAQWMRHLGASDAAVTQATRDGGIDVESANFVVEVKHRSVPIGPSYVREIFGVAQAKRKRAAFFSQGGYTKDATRFGRETGVLLFVYDATRGTLAGVTPESRRAIAEGLADEGNSSR